MKAIFLFAAVLLCSCLVSCTENSERWEQKQIDEFGTELARVLLADDVEAYLKLWLTADSVPLNINTKKAAQVPTKTEWLREGRKAAYDDFKRVTKEIRQQLGADTGISLNQIDYSIDRHPWKVRDGLFEFIVTLQFERQGRQVLVSQWSCIMTTSGVRVGDSPALVNKEGIEIPIKTE